LQDTEARATRANRVIIRLGGVKKERKKERKIR